MSSKKNSLFLGLARELTYDLKLRLPFSIIIETLSCGQVISLILQTSFLSVQDGLFQWFTQLKKILLTPSLFLTYDIASSDEGSEFIWFICAFYLFLYGILMVIKAIDIKKGTSFLWLSKLLTVLSLVHSRLLFFPIYLYFLQILQSSVEKKLTDSDFFINSAGVFIVTILLLGINCTLAFSKELFFYRIDKDKSSYACKTNLPSQLALFYKALAATILVLITKTTLADIIINLTGIIYAILVLYVLYSRLSFYNLKLLQYSFVLASITLSFEISCLVDYLASVDNLGIATLCITTPFLVIILRNKQLTVFKRILSGNFGTAERAVHFPILLKSYTSRYDTLITARKRFPFVSLFFYSFFASNVYDSEAIKDVKTENLINQDFYLSLIKKCTESRNNYKKSEVFLLYNAKIWIKKFGNTFQALSFMEEAQAANSSVYVIASINNIYSLLRKAFTQTSNSKSANNFELGDYFSHREQFQLLKNDMQNEVKAQLLFWQEMAQFNMDAKNIVFYCEKIDDVYKKIKKRWQKNEWSFHNSYSISMLLYSFYMDLVRGMPQESIPLLRKYLNAMKNSKTKNKADLGSETTVVMTASIERDKLGIVMDASDSVMNMFGIQRERLIGTRINQLMPNFIAAHHDRYLQNYTQISPNQESKTKTKRRSYGRTVNGGALKEIELELKVYPYLDKGVNLMAHIKQISSESQMMIIDPEGRIAACSSALQKALKLNGMNLEAVSVLEISPELMKINHAYNVFYSSSQPVIEQFNSSSTNNIRTVTAKHKLEHDLYPSVLDETSKRVVREDSLHSLLLNRFQSSNVQISPFIQSPLRKPRLFDPRSKTATEASAKVISEEKAKEICNRYQVGDKIELYPYMKTTSSRKVGVKFSVSIKPYFLNEMVYKVVQLLSMDSAQEFKYTQFSVHTNHKNEEIKTLFKPFNSSEQKENTSKQEIPDEIPFEDETENPIIVNHRMEVFKDEIDTKKLFSELHGLIELQDEKQLIAPQAVKKHLEKLKVKKSMTMLGGQSSQGSVSNMNLRLIKRLGKVLEAKKNSPLTKLSIWLVYIVLLSILVSVLINFMITYESLNKVQNSVDIINTVGQRLNRAVIAYEWMLMFYSRLLGLRPFFTVYGYSRKYIFNVTTQMSQINKQLKKKIEVMDYDEITQLFLSNKIKFYDESGREMVQGHYLDSFSASNQIILQNLFIGNYSDTDAKLVKRPEFITSINNTGNDYLLESENLSGQVYEHLKEMIDSNVSQSSQILVLEHLGLVVLGISLVLVAIIIFKSYSKLFQALTRVSNDTVEMRINQIKKFDNMLKQNTELEAYLNEVDNTMNMNNWQQNVTPAKKAKYMIKNYSSLKLIIHLTSYLMASAILIIIISGLFLVLHFQSLSSFSTLGLASKQIYTINKLNYQGPLVLANFYLCIIFQNQTSMLLRREAPLTQLEKNLQYFSNINEELIETFPNDPIIEDLFGGRLCRYLPLSVQVNCDTATEGSTFGLLGLNSKSLAVATHYIDLYKSDPTTANAIKLLKPYYDIGVAIDFVMDATFTFITSYILGKFSNEISGLKNSQLSFSLGAAFVIFLAAIAMQKITIKRFVKLDQSQRKVFKVLSYYVLSQNKALSFLLQKEFKNEVHGLSKILSA